MQARNQALSLSGRQHSPALLYTKGASVAKAVDEFRQLLARHPRNKFPHDRLDIGVRASGVFRRQGMRGKESGHEFKV